MAKTAILVGPLAPVREALQALSCGAHKIVCVGAAYVGPGELDTVVTVANAPAWEALDFSNAVKADMLILASPAPSRAAARHVLTKAADAHLKPYVMDQGVLRRMSLDELVGRALAEVDWDRIRQLISGKRVLVTGGGGSIGGELVRRLAHLKPERLCVLDCSEYNLFKMQQELPHVAIALADVRSPIAVRKWFERERPDIVFHAAALKQVPMVEAHPSEGVLTNVIGCRNVADACASFGADMIFVSTDKAVNPSGVMGATKRLAEMYCQALDRENATRGPRFLPVRLGNVLGSAGSVTPLFESQLAAGGPLTVTDAEMTRYFISIPQAADYLLQAGAAAIGSENARGAAFVLDMGEALPVVRLAQKMIQLEGLRPNVDVPIAFVGLRPGEKLHEDLVAADEWREADPAPSVMAAASSPRSLAELREIIDTLALLACGCDDVAVLDLLRASVAPAMEPAAAAARA